MRLWDLATGERAGVFTGHRGVVWHVLPVTVGGRPHALTGGRDRTLRLWDLDSGVETETHWLPAIPYTFTVLDDGTVVVGVGSDLLALTPGPELPPLRPLTPVPSF